MFNLETAIAEWRRAVKAAGLSGNATLDELEEHIRADVEREIGEGSEPKQAFERAVAALGPTAELIKEFSKVTPGRAAALMQLLRISCYITAPVIAGLCVYDVLDGELNLWGRLSRFVLGCVGALYIARLPVFYRRLSGPKSPVFRTLIKVLVGCIASFPIIGLLNGAGVLHLNISLTTTMVCDYLYVITALTAFAAACRAIEIREGQVSDVVPGQDFTTSAQDVLGAARRHALRLGHDYIGTEHLLLGILDTQNACIERLFSARGIREQTIREDLMKFVIQGSRSSLAEEIPYTPRSQKVLEYAQEEARMMRGNLVGSEHLFLGLVREVEGLAGLTLRQHHFELNALRKEIRRALDDGDESGHVIAAG